MNDGVWLSIKLAAISDRLDRSEKSDQTSGDIDTSFSCVDYDKWFESSEGLNVRECNRHLISTAQINYF